MLAMAQLCQETAEEKRIITRKQLFPKHPAFLIELFDNNPLTVLEDAFPNLETFISGRYKYIREKYALSLKRVTKNTVERDTTKIIQLRFDIITQWEAASINY
ncbi:hypothetical protein RMATCC62417_01728 [Rhizopus microsporus]|nr:hypothetical protein RMATCC62417_01728 [Rhizopus microsporus]